jgi:threonyl-tRNA synthetase
MIHSALLGSVERFLSVYIEHTAGKFPVWLAPEQIRLVTVNQEETTVNFAQKVLEQSKALGLRVSIDNDNESVGKKIRNAEVMKVPYVVVIGEKEVGGSVVMPRIRKDLEVLSAHPELTFDTFLKTVANEAKSRTAQSSL